MVTGNEVDFLLLTMTPAEDAVAYRGFDLAVGYGLLALVFLAVGLFSRPVEPDSSANTTHL